MPDVSLKFSGESVIAVEATKRVDDALGDLSAAAVETRAALAEALGGLDSTSAQRDLTALQDEMGDTERKAIEMRAALAAAFTGLDTSSTGSGIGSLLTTLGLLVPAALAAGIALNGIGASLFAVGAALAPTLTSFLAAPAILGAVVAGAGALILAFQGVGDALKAGTALQEDNGIAAQQLADKQEAAAARVVTAQQAVVDAHRAVEDAEHNLELANRGVEDANNRLVDAIDAVEAAQRRLVDAHYAVDTALRNLALAEEDLRNAQISETQAQEDLTRARHDAAEALVDLSFRVQDAQLSEERATISLAQAQENLAKLEASGTATATQLADARLRVREAELRLEEAKRASELAQAALDEAETNGVENAPNVVAAKQKVQDANDGVRDATQRVEDAQHALTTAEQGVIDAQKALVDANQGVIAAQQGVEDAAYAVTKAQQALGDAQDNVVTSNQALVKAQNDLNDTLSTLTGPMQKFHDAMANLSPPAQDFVNLLLSMKPLFEDLRTTAAAGIFPGLTDLLQGIAANFDTFKAVLGDVSAALGGFFSDLGTWLGSSDFATKFGALGTIFATVISNLGDAFISFSKALLDISVAAGPFIDWITSGIAKLGEMAAKAADAGLESGGLASAFDDAKEALTLLWNVLKPTVEIIIAFGEAAAPIGRVILKDLADQLDRVADWAQSSGGQATLTSYFTDAKDVLYAVAGLLVDIVADVAKLARSFEVNIGLLDLIGAIRDDLLPAVDRLAEAIVKAFGPVVHDIIIKLVDDLKDVANFLTPIVDGIGDFLKQHPALSDMVSTIGEMSAIFFALSKLGITSVITNLALALLSMVVPAESATAAMLGLDAAMDANPVGAVVLAIEALVVAFVLAYQHSETFRNIISGLLDVVLRAVDFFQRWHGVLLLLIPILGPLLFAIANIGTAIDIVTSSIGAVVSAFNTLSGVVGSVRTILTNVITVIKSFVDNALKAATSLGDAIYDGIVKGVTGVATEVATFLNRIVTIIKDHVAGTLAAAKSLGTAIYNGIKNAVTGIATFVGTVMNNVVKAITGYVTRAAQAGAAIGRAVAAGIRNAFSNIATIIGSLVRGALNSALKIVNAAIGTINTALDFTINLPDVIPGLPDEIHFNSPNIPYIPYLAEGGIVTAPTLAVLGEKGAEAVIPLDNAGLSGTTVHLHVQGSIVHERDLVRTIVDGISEARTRTPGILKPSAAGIRR